MFADTSHRHAPSGGVNNDAHQAARNDASHRQSDDPSKVDPAHHAPVDGPPCPSREPYTDGGARDALSRRNWELCRER